MHVGVQIIKITIVRLDFQVLGRLRVQARAVMVLHVVQYLLRLQVMQV